MGAHTVIHMTPPPNKCFARYTCVQRGGCVGKIKGATKWWIDSLATKFVSSFLITDAYLYFFFFFLVLLCLLLYCGEILPSAIPRGCCVHEMVCMSVCVTALFFC